MVFVFLDFPGQFVQHAGGVLDFAQQLLDVQQWTFGLLKSPLGDADDLVQFGLDSDGQRLLLLLRFEEQLRVGKDAFARLGFGLAPGVVDRRGLARGPALVGEDSGHLEALFKAHSRHRHQIAHAICAPILPSRTCCWTASGSVSTNDNRRATQLLLRSKLLARSSIE